MSASPDIRDAASVILVRERGGGPQLEVYLVRRHRKAGFMASSFVFPGGIADGRDHGDLRATAVRELFEEAGVLLSTPAVEQAIYTPWRARVDKDGADLEALLAETGAVIARDLLHDFAHWITPSIEPRRYSARFYVARLPEGQSASPCDRETVDDVWVTPEEALARADELRLPPPQQHTFMSMCEAAAKGWTALVELCRQRAQAPFPILPRARTMEGSELVLLLPWDREYESHGTGDAHPIPANHPLAHGPSRFVIAGGRISPAE